MRSIAYFGVPLAAERAKDSSKLTPIAGFSVAEAELVKSLLLYGSYENYFFICRSSGSINEAKELLFTYPNNDRTEVVSIAEFEKIKAYERVILLSASSILSELIQARKLLDRPKYPIVGFTHALSYLIGLPHILNLLLEQVNIFDAIICTSSAGKMSVEKLFESTSSFISHRFGFTPHYKGKLPVAPLGIDTEIYYPRDKAEARSKFSIPQEKKVFLYLGRFSDIDKMDPFPLLIAFAKTFAADKEKPFLILSGDDTHLNLTKTLQNFAVDLGCSDMVKILPDISSQDKPWLYSAADCFVSISDSVQETFGLTVIEAMASGLPVIGSDWSGYKESVKDGVTGILVPTYSAKQCMDTVSSAAPIVGEGMSQWLLGQSIVVDIAHLSSALRFMAENDFSRIEMGRQGRKVATEKYCWREVIKRYETIWEDLFEVANSATPVIDPLINGITSLHHSKVFDHYPTGSISLETELEITQFGFEISRERMEKLLQQRYMFFDVDIFKQILSIFIRHQKMNTKTVVKYLALDFEVTTEAIFQYIVRLVKYGLLDTSSKKT